MTFKVRLKIPKKSDKKVSYSSEFRLQDGQQVPMFKLVLRLPPEKLALVEKKPNKYIQNTEDSEKANSQSNGSSETQATKTQDDEEFESDLSSLDMELNKALSSATSIFSSSTFEGVNKFEERNNKEVSQKTKETKTVKTTRPNNPPGGTEYRHIPSNLTPILKVEFGNDDESDEEVGILDRITVTLRDPLSASKIKLPLRSTACKHFECFDFDCFCLFNKIPIGIKTLVKKDLAKRNFESKSKGKISLPSYNLKQDSQRSAVEIINYPKLQNGKKRQIEPSKLPVYRCPVCNQPFSLGQLYISDVFNYFVKATPKDICRVEIRDMNKYKIVDDSRSSATAPANANSSACDAHIVVLSDDERDDDYDPENLNLTTYGQSPLPLLKQETPSVDLPTTTNHQNNELAYDQYHHQNSLENTDDVFNDGLDDELVRLSMPNLHTSASTGTGSWEDPVTID